MDMTIAAQELQKWMHRRGDKGRKVPEEAIREYIRLRWPHCTKDEERKLYGAATAPKPRARRS
jgi:hypothetical protein